MWKRWFGFRIADIVGVLAGTTIELLVYEDGFEIEKFFGFSIFFIVGWYITMIYLPVVLLHLHLQRKGMLPNYINEITIYVVHSFVAGLGWVIGGINVFLRPNFIILWWCIFALYLIVYWYFRNSQNKTGYETKL